MSVTGYITAFRRAAQWVANLSPDKCLDKFLHGLKPQLLERVLQVNPVDFEAACRAAEHATAVLMYVQQRGSASRAAASHGVRHMRGHSNHQMAVRQHTNQSSHVPMELKTVQASRRLPF